MRNSRPSPVDPSNRQSVLKSFLDSSPNWLPGQQESENPTCTDRHIAVPGQNQECGVCLQPLPETEKKKQCKFCGMNICNDHVRKRRQLENKFERICDDCEDKYLFERLKKYQAKAQQAQVMQEQIMSLKWEDTLERLRGKQLKVKALTTQTTELLLKYQKKHDLMMDEYKIMLEKEKQLALDFTVLEKQEQEQKDHSARLPRPLDDDVVALQTETDKLNKELLRLEKRKTEAKLSLERKQKQIGEEYARWEAQEQAKAAMVKPQKDNCTTF